jgi:phage terminase large subunit-like protein
VVINTEKAQVESRKLIAPTRQMDVLERAGDKHLIARPIVRRDEEGKLYDLTTAFQEEATFFPYGTHDDLIDAVSRIYDMQAVPPVNNESAASIEALEPEYPDA